MPSSYGNARAPIVINIIMVLIITGQSISPGYINVRLLKQPFLLSYLLSLSLSLSLSLLFSLTSLFLSHYKIAPEFIFIKIEHIHSAQIAGVIPRLEYEKVAFIVIFP